MTDFDLNCKESVIKEFIRLSIKGENGSGTLAAVLCGASFLAVGVLCFLIYLNFSNIWALAVFFCALLFCVGLFAVLGIMSDRAAKKLYKAYKANEGLVCCVAENGITVVRDNRPVNVIGWGDITSITEGESGFFLVTKDNVLLALGRENVLSGDISEAQQIIAAKKKALAGNEG